MVKKMCGKRGPFVQTDWQTQKIRYFSSNNLVDSLQLHKLKGIVFL